MDYTQIKNATVDLITTIVRGDFEKLYQEDYRKTINVSELTEAIDGYRATITMPPLEAFENIDVYETQDKDIVKIDFDLWFDNEVSDLTVSFTLYQTNSNYKYSINNTHIL